VDEAPLDDAPDVDTTGNSGPAGADLADAHAHLHARERALGSRPMASLEAEGVPDLADTLPGKELTGDPQEGIAPPRVHPSATTDPAVTDPGQGHPIGLDAALAREVPDIVAADPADRTGRLVGDDVRESGGLTGGEVDLDAADLSAEEDAVHIVVEP
jgi:hypothetical protein